MASEHSDSQQKKETAAKPATEENRILLWCAYCGQKYRLRQSLAGKSGTCDNCHNNFIIPKVSQTEPELKKTISFQCQHCGKKQLKAQELAGTEVNCYECGKKNIIPETLTDQASPVNQLEPFLVAETTRTDLTLIRPAAESVPEDKILFWCNHCGQKYRLPRRLDGKAGICSKCKNYLFIPHVSQTEPELKKTISFPCQHCGKKQLKAQELIGTEVSCYACDKKNIVPAKSKKSLIQRVNPAKLLAPFIVAETTRTDMVAADDKILFWCSHCGQKYYLPRHLDGKAGMCVRCQNYLFIPHVSQTKPKLEKTVVFPCKYCGKKLRKARKLAGTETRCSKCSEKVIVPAKSKISSLAKAGAAPEDRILFWCSYCAQKYRLPQHLAGRTGTCDNCQKDFIIPHESQIKPKLKKTVLFPCKHCGKELWEAQELFGTEVECNKCGGKNIVPQKSNRAFLKKLDQTKIVDAALVIETMKKGLSTIAKQVQTPFKPKLSSETETAAKASFQQLPKSSIVSDKTPGTTQAPPTSKQQIIITRNPPVIHRLKNYFNQKAEKYFIFAMFVIFIDYIIHARETGLRPSKSFILFSTFAIAAIILLGTWNFVMAAPPDKSNKSRYNITCTKCGYHEVRRFKDISKQACAKCAEPVGFTYHCENCNKDFVYAESAAKKEAEEAKTEETSFNDPIPVKCPFCHSEDTHYLTIKEAAGEKKSPDKTAG